MCGIAGIISHHPSPADTSRLKKMTLAIAHRGPDGEAHWINNEGNVALGHRRLAIIDLSADGRQPMHCLNRYTIIHNGEIYNYIELKDELKKRGYPFYTQTDTEVIAAAYDCWGDECVDFFDGMFAFAIWDTEKKELFAARDRFGEKPFYFFSGESDFVFASEMKALWAAGIEKKPNRKLLFNFITIGYTDNPENPEETFYENIVRLPAASFLLYSAADRQIRITKYWDIDPEKRDGKIKDTEAIERFQQLFALSVKRRLRSDVPAGISLSGGLDSSSIAATISQLQIQNHELQTFSALFPGYEKDEAVYAKQVAGMLGAKQFTITPSASSMIGDWEMFIQFQEEPFGSSSNYAQYKVYQLAKQENVKVLLDGQGADETLAGYHKYYKWYWQELFQKRKLFRSRELKAARLNHVKESFGFRNIMASLFPDFASVFLEKQYLMNALRHEDLDKDFALKQGKEAYYTRPSHLHLNGILYFNTLQHGLEELLRYADRNSMAHGREIRLPFLNHELVEFVFSLPAHFKIRKGWTKWILRESMKDKLPGEIAWRKEKTGFEPPQEQWLQHKEIQELIHEAKKILVNEKVLNPGSLKRKVKPRGAYAADNYDWRYLSSALLFK